MRISDWSSDVCSSELDRWRQIAVAAAAVQHHTALFEGPDADARSGAALEELGNLPDIGIDAVKAATGDADGERELGAGAQSDRLGNGGVDGRMHTGVEPVALDDRLEEIGRGSCRVRGCEWV